MTELMNGSVRDQLQKLMDENMPGIKIQRNYGRQFSDGVLMAQIIHHYRKELVEIHNYSTVGSFELKKTNWEMLKRKVLSKLDISMNKMEIEEAAKGKAEVIDIILIEVSEKLGWGLRFDAKSKAPEKAVSKRPYSTGKLSSPFNPETTIKGPAQLRHSFDSQTTPLTKINEHKTRTGPLVFAKAGKIANSKAQAHGKKIGASNISKHEPVVTMESPLSLAESGSDNTIAPNPTCTSAQAIKNPNVPSPTSISAPTPATENSNVTTSMATSAQAIENPNASTPMSAKAKATVNRSTQRKEIQTQIMRNKVEDYFEDVKERVQEMKDFGDEFVKVYRQAIVYHKAKADAIVIQSVTNAYEQAQYLKSQKPKRSFKNDCTIA